MDNIEIYENPEFGKVRTVLIDDEPYFVGKDVTDILGYGNSRQALTTNVDDEDKEVHSVDTLGGTQKMTVINESGLYSLILGSKLPTAKKFKKWVTSEVLPSIRKTGSYTTSQMSAMEMIAELANNAVKVEKTLNDYNTRLDELEKKSNVNFQHVVNEALTYATLSYEHQKYIKAKVALKVISFCPDYNDYRKKRIILSNKLYADLRKRFGVTSFRNIRVKDFNSAVKFIDEYETR